VISPEGDRAARQARMVPDLAALVHLRWLATLLVLVASAALAVFRSTTVLYLIILAVGIAVAYESILWATSQPLLELEHLFAARLRWGYHWQVGLDLLILTLVVALSGGLVSPAMVFYLPLAVFGALLLSTAGAVGYAVLCGAAIGLIALDSWIGPALTVSLWSGSVSQPGDALYLVLYLCSALLALVLSAFAVSVLRRHLAAKEWVLRERETSLERRAASLQEANERLEKVANLAKARTAPALKVAHELRAPLAAIQSSLDLILRGYATEPGTTPEEMVKIARDSAADLLQLVNDLLYLGRIKDMGSLAESEMVQLTEILKAVAGAVRAEAAENNIELVVYVPDGVPPVRGNREYLHQLVFNLIDNAIKYTGPSGKVSASAWYEDGLVKGKVKDTGIGIRADDLPKVFDEFFRADNAKKLRRAGTGLGLPIVKKIVELHGGHIDVQSHLGEGTTFTFELPEGKA
jgi:signal transduction histidine kinase